VSAPPARGGCVSAPDGRYEAVIGLEVHVHLATRSKLFSPAPVRYGDAPNHDVHWIDLGLPGVLPVLNERVVELAVRFGLATGARVEPRSVFARKNYFYPDLPKGYQISQYEAPVLTGGWIEIEVPKDGEGTELRRIRLTRAHLEEDAGKLIHAAGAGAGSEVDLNRAGVPLLEIVSEPELRSPEEAGAFLRTLRSILRYLRVSEADMEKGQFRCDANVSLRPRGETRLGTRTELKNLNSFRFVEEATAAEIERQAEVLDAGGEVRQATLGFDPATGTTRVQRVKESADDYRYFPDPDLIPLAVSDELVERVRAALPELPGHKRRRFQEEHGLSEYDARLLTESRELADFFEEAVRLYGQPKPVANWILRDLLQALKEREEGVEALAITPEALAALIRLVDEGRLTARSARELFPELVERGGDPQALMQERGLEAVSDRGAIEGAIGEVLEANPKIVAQVRAGDPKPLNFLMGQVMKRTQGKANPGLVRKLLAERIGASEE
jgi:aspartyl-tRNA(Asn)/glutamyl-tRNA(Gln) amidotransferase subunit B